MLERGRGDAELRTTTALRTARKSTAAHLTTSRWCSTKCYTDSMPTKKRRYTITADKDVEFALRRGRRSFPAGTSDSRILAALVSKGEQALEQENLATSGQEQRRRSAAGRLADRFRRPEGLDYAALGEASARWLDG